MSNLVSIPDEPPICYELKIPSCNKVKNKWKVPEIAGLNRVATETMETAEVEQ